MVWQFKHQFNGKFAIKCSFRDSTTPKARCCTALSNTIGFEKFNDCFIVDLLLNVAVKKFSESVVRKIVPANGAIHILDSVCNDDYRVIG